MAHRRIQQMAILIFFAIIVVAAGNWLAGVISPPLFDWRVFWEAPLSSPYSRYGFLNPYWLKWIIAPLHLLTDDYRVGHGIWAMLTIVTITAVFYRNKWILFASISSPYFVHLILNGQVDVLVALGYILLLRDRKSTRLNSSHIPLTCMPPSA